MQDKRCLDCLINAPLKDSNLVDLNKSVKVLQSEIENQNEKILLSEHWINSLNNEIKSKSRKIIVWKIVAVVELLGLFILVLSII